MSAPDFEAVRDLVKSASGIHLHQGKVALVSSRLERLVRAHGFHSFTDYVRFLSGRQHGPEFTEFIDTLTTNHSGFWREPEHFILLSNTVFREHRSRTRIWSAACATGEEPYTIAMCALAVGACNCTITATDISTAALQTAREGSYESSRLTSLPAGWRDRFFAQNSASAKGCVSSQVRNMVNFRPLNLLQPFQQMGQFDVIFCRNVMIYFEQPTREALVSRLVSQLIPGGFLFTGHSETLLQIPPGLTYVQPATYRKL